MLEVFDSIGAFIPVIDCHLQGQVSSMKLGEIVREWTAIQQKLLSLSTSGELDIIPPSSSKSSIYECYRLTALIFSVAVVLPVPNSYNLLQDLVQRRKKAIEIINIETCESELFGVLLWTLVLGGIAALDGP